MSPRRLHHSLRSAPEAVAAVNGSGCLLDLNSRAARLFGVEHSAALGRPVAEFLPDAQRLKAGMPTGSRETATAEPSPVLEQALTLTGRRADGTEFPADVVFTPDAEDPSVRMAWIRDRSACDALRAESVGRAAALDCAEHLSCAGSLEWDPLRRRLVCSKNLTRLLGLDPHSHVSRRDVLHEHSHPDDRPQFDEALEQVIDGRDLDPIDLRFVGADGGLRYFRFASRRVSDNEHQVNRMIGVMRDVTEERLAARRIDLRLAVSQTLANWSTLEQSAPELLTAIAAPLEGQIATLWLPEGDVLIPRFTWAAERLPGSDFERTTRALRLPRGIGLPGWAWALRRPVDAATLTAERSYIRREDAERAGLKTAVAFPALCGEEVVAVIDLHVADKVDITTQSLHTFTGIGHEIGNLLSSRRGRLTPNPLTPRELDVLKLAAEGLTNPDIAERLVVSPSTIKTHLEHVYAKLAVSDRAAAVAQALRRGLID